VLVAPPLVLKQPSRLGMMGGALLPGISGPESVAAWHREHGSYKLYFFVSTGHVSCYSKTGDFLWQSPTLARWGLDEHVADALAMGPSLTAFRLRSDEPTEDFLLASAAGFLVLLRASNGEIMSSVPLPASSMGVTVGDFSGDGYNDVIVTTTKGSVGFALRRAFGAQIFTILIAVLLAALLGVFGFKFSQGLKTSRPGDRDAGASVRRLGPRARVTLGKDGKQS